MTRTAWLGAFALLACACDAGPDTVEPVAPVPVTSAAQVVQNDCLGCHTESMMRQQRLTGAQWTKVVDKMVRWGAPTEGEALALLADDLSAHYGPDAGPYELDRMPAEKVAELFAPLPDGVLSGGDPERGHEIYTELCMPCHMSDGRGGALGLNLVRRRVLDRASDFAAAVRTGSGRMPGFDATDEQVADLLAYARSLP